MLEVLKVGLTGGMAVGKSAVGEMFASLGAQVIQADEISHQLMQPGHPVYREVVRHFGAGILNQDGTVNRARLAESAFGGSGDSPTGKAARVRELNEIVHPAVIQRQQEWMEEVEKRDTHSVAMVEAALILEAGMAKNLDRLVVVTCAPQQRVERFARRLKVDEEAARREISRRMAAQLPDDEKIKAADFVIDNSRSLDETRRQVAEVYAALKKEA
jgi:dephospho-CoA kinase